MGLFSGLERLGLSGVKETDILKKNETETANAQGAKAVKKIEFKETDVIFDKRYTCPVCDTIFTSKCVKAGKLKNIGKDSDLRPIYEHMDPLKYDVITCTKCGYSSITRYFGKLSTRQIKEIRTKFSDSFMGIDDKGDGIFTYDDSITRYKLALFCSVLKNAKNGERAYTCLKLAWVLRGKAMSLSEDDPTLKEVKKDELESLSYAYQGFVEAMQNEPFPIAGMDEHVLQYVLADLARKLKKYEESLRLLAKVLTSKATPARLKDQALELKDLIKEELKQSDIEQK